VRSLNRTRTSTFRKKKNCELQFFFRTWGKGDEFGERIGGVTCRKHEKSYEINRALFVGAELGGGGDSRLVVPGAPWPGKGNWPVRGRFVWGGPSSRKSSESVRSTQSRGVCLD